MTRALNQHKNGTEILRKIFKPHAFNFSFNYINFGAIL